MTTVTQAELLLVAGLTAIYVGAFCSALHPTSLRDRAPEAIALVALAGIAALSLYYVHAAIRSIRRSSPRIVLSGALGAVASRWTAVAARGAHRRCARRRDRDAASPRPEAVGLDTMRIGALEWTMLGDAGARPLRAASPRRSPSSSASAASSAPTARPRPRPAPPAIFAASGAGAPLLILVVVYLRHVPFETRPAIGIAALIMAAVFAAMTERLIARRPHDDMAPAPALYAAGAVLALSFAAAVGLAVRFIPLALSLGAAGVVWVSLYRPVKVLAWLAVVVAALACLAVAFGPPLTPEEIGTRPILNGLILRFGLPAVAVLFAGETLRRRRDGIEAAILQAIGLVLAALFVTLEIRHWANGGVLSPRTAAPRRAERADACGARLLARPAADRAADEEQGLRGRLAHRRRARRGGDRDRAFRHRQPGLHRRERRHRRVPEPAPSRLSAAGARRRLGRRGGAAGAAALVCAPHRGARARCSPSPT